MRSATCWMISTFGAIIGLMGVEHGIGEVLQGNAAPSGLVFPSWPESEFFRSLGGEPAMSIIPNLLVSGILAILVSTAYLAWATLFVRRKNSGLWMILLAVLMLLVGGGIFPPILGVLIGAAATRIGEPPAWWQSRLSPRVRQFMKRLWPWAFAACLACWLSMFPGIPVLSYFFGIENETLIFILLIGMFGFLILSAMAGFARDSQPTETLAGA